MNENFFLSVSIVGMKSSYFVIGSTGVFSGKWSGRTFTISFSVLGRFGFCSEGFKRLEIFIQLGMALKK